MLQKVLVLVLGMASIALGTGCGTTANNYIYATLPATNQIIAWREDPNSGYLTQLTGSPYAAGEGANSVVLHPSGKFLYTSNPGQGENDISLFSVSTNGTLKEVFPRTAVTPNASQPEFLAMDPAGNYLYVANAASENISVFSIDASAGTLSPVTGSPFAIGLPPQNMKLTPSGNFLYVTAPSQPYGLIIGYSVTAGVLSSIGVTSTAGLNPSGLVIDPKGSYLYTGNSSSNSISIFSISSTGGLTPVAQSPINDSYTSPLSLTFDPTGTYLYVANEGSANVTVFSISSSTGLPAILTTSTTTGAFSTEPNPSFLAFDPKGKYLFVGNQGTSAAVQPFVVSNGNLTEITTYGTGNTPSSIAVLGK